MSYTMATEMKQAQAVAKLEVNHQEVDQLGEKFELLMEPKANWEKFLMPAPISVATLGELVIKSMEEDDFHFSKDFPKERLKYMKGTETFRTCLYEVSQRGWKAFNNANSNTDMINVWFECFSEMMEGVIQGALVGRDELQTDREEAEACKSTAQETKEQFLDSVNYLQELLQVWSKAKLSFNEQLKAVQKEWEQATGQEKRIKQDVTHAKKNQVWQEKQEEAAISQLKAIRTSCPLAMKEEDNSEIEQHRKRLVDIQERYEGSCETLIQLTETRKETEKTRMKLEFAERELEAKVVSLGHGLEALGKVKEQWEKMVSFFQMISHLIDSCLNWIKDYLGSAEDKQHINQAFEAFSVAHLGQVMSETYTKINGKSPSVLSQAKEILCLDCSDAHFSSKKAELDKACEAQKAQSHLVLEMREKFKKKLSKVEEKIKR
ncbi:centrosome-associated protein CEP250-like isoform X1 [Alligator sinensis]|uniref:Centrosome-associated protein CEP250-like isoform X1 n=2 Tax=Alligator sinensis TaxID=38654 RepID=A0A3Q0FZJ3_ALLSI|nr:centrosome-associated protein CEP250-like isoform X1 [Alligator sinensis]